MTLIKFLFILSVVLATAQIVLLFTNRPLFCKIAMLGGIHAVPAICLEDAIKDVLKNN